MPTVDEQTEDRSGRNYWDRHAAKYDASVQLLLARPIPKMLELVASACRGADHVLELAAGTGLVTAAIAARARKVTATDYAAGMVEKLEQRVRARGLDNVRCEQADLYDLPYRAHSFDVVVAANVLHLVPDVSEALDAMVRALGPGGKLVLPTFCHDQTLGSWLLSRGLAMTGFPGQRRFTAESLVSALEDRGLRITYSELLAGPIPIMYIEV